MLKLSFKKFLALAASLIVFTILIVIGIFYWSLNLPPFGCSLASFQDNIYTVKLETPEHKLSSKEIARLRAYGRLYTADYYLDFNDYGYLVISIDNQMNDGEEARYGYKKMDTREFCKLSSNASKILKEKDEISLFLAPQYKYDYDSKNETYSTINIYSPDAKVFNNSSLYQITDYDKAFVLFTNKVEGYKIKVPRNWKIDWHYPDYVQFTEDGNIKLTLILEAKKSSYVNWNNIYRKNSDPKTAYRRLTGSDRNAIYVVPNMPISDGFHDKSLVYYQDGVEGAPVFVLVFFDENVNPPFRKQEIELFDSMALSYQRINDQWPTMAIKLKDIKFKFPPKYMLSMHDALDTDSINIVNIQEQSLRWNVKIIESDSKNVPHGILYKLEDYLITIRDEGKFTQETRVRYTSNGFTLIKFSNDIEHYKYVAYFENGGKAYVIEKVNNDSTLEEFMIFVMSLADAKSMRVYSSIPGLNY